jgi:hypothetical protein
VISGLIRAVLLFDLGNTMTTLDHAASAKAPEGVDPEPTLAPGADDALSAAADAPKLLS